MPWGQKDLAKWPVSSKYGVENFGLVLVVVELVKVVF